MTLFEIKADWNITKAALKQRWRRLSDEDLQYSEGRYEELLSRIQQRTGESRDAIAIAIKESTVGCGAN